MTWVFIFQKREETTYIFVKLFIQNEKNKKKIENVIIQKKSDQIMLKDVYL
jgi:hypothetical protein